MVTHENNEWAVNLQRFEYPSCPSIGVLAFRFLDGAGSQSLKWSGSIRQTENPIKSKWSWIGLDYTNPH